MLYLAMILTTVSYTHLTLPTKRVRPFVDVAYQYEKGQKATNVQEATESEKGWKYGAGIELVF